MINKIVDLHIHSYYSDGTMSPEEILIEASKNGVGLLAITDHDMISGSLELKMLNDKYDIKCIPAVELNAIDCGINYHILGYGINLLDTQFCSFVEKNRILLEEVNIKLIEKMQKDNKSITVADYLQFNYDKKKGGWKALHYFMEKGLTKNLFEGFALYAKYEHSYSCVEFPSIQSVCQHIHSAGGRAVLAHPGKVIKETDRYAFRNEVLRLIDIGLDGIECYYPSHSDDLTEVCLSICKDKNLLITAGCDCHGEFQDTKVGEMGILMNQINLGDIC